MMLLKSQNLQQWMDSTGKNQQWLAGQLGIGKSYMSMLMHNKCLIYRGICDKLLNITHANFDAFFLVLPDTEDREFYGKEIWFQGKMVSSQEYVKQVKEMITTTKDRHLEPIFPATNKKW